VPSLNTLTDAFHPNAVDKSVLVLYAPLGLGTALAPAFVTVFVGIGFWTGLQLLVACLLLGLIGVSLRLPLNPAGRPRPVAHQGRGAQQPRGSGRSPGRGIPAVFWLFAAFALLYGFCETMNGNWSQLDITSLGVRPAAPRPRAARLAPVAAC
jgi:hypothetical protein